MQLKAVYKVTYKIEGNDQKFEAMCSISEGYTTFADIPKIIAIKRGVRPEQLDILSAVKRGTAGVVNIHGANYGNIQM